MSCDYREEEKNSLLNEFSNSDPEGRVGHERRASVVTKACLYSILGTFASLTATISLIALMIFLSKYHALGDNYIHLRKKYAELEAQKASLEEHVHIARSPHAGLLPEITSTYYERTSYNDPDHEDLADALWDSIDFDAGIVALSDDYAKQKKLPIAQRFPWDLTKGIYLLNGHHHLHCLKSVHGAIKEYRKGLPQSRPSGHVSHCLDALRREIICDADDTPRASTREYSPNTGVGQYRQCRSWEKLERWATKNSACYKYLDPTNTTMSNLERFAFCPEGSPYWDAVRRVYPDAGMGSQ